MFVDAREFDLPTLKIDGAVVLLRSLSSVEIESRTSRMLATNGDLDLRAYNARYWCCDSLFHHKCKVIKSVARICMLLSSEGIINIQR